MQGAREPLCGDFRVAEATNHDYHQDRHLALSRSPTMQIRIGYE